jgi:hypothetical protein
MADPEFANLQKAVREISNRPKLFLNVAYHQRDRAKELGASFDAVSSRWYIPAGNLKNLCK